VKYDSGRQDFCAHVGVADEEWVNGRWHDDESNQPSRSDLMEYVTATSENPMRRSRSPGPGGEKKSPLPTSVDDGLI
jgi:hypothetical protein